ncbi:MAG: hypothetical protein VX642_04850 [Bdellovibrionota bacterium]|nr:hypothetical protein [Bdellovibrionota bacterium]
MKKLSVLLVSLLAFGNLFAKQINDADLKCLPSKKIEEAILKQVKDRFKTAYAEILNRLLDEIEVDYKVEPNQVEFLSFNYLSAGNSNLKTATLTPKALVEENVNGDTYKSNISLPILWVRYETLSKGRSKLNASIDLKGNCLVKVSTGLYRVVGRIDGGEPLSFVANEKVFEPEHFSLVDLREATNYDWSFTIPIEEI